MNPYVDLPPSAFWRTAVAAGNPVEAEGLWTPRFTMKGSERFATFGSCFAQHISRALVARGFTWLDAEPAPALLLPEQRREYNYGIFSARTGNIYTTTLLLQWVKWACGRAEPPEEVWKRDERFYDPFRPNIEPNGFCSEEEARSSLRQAITSFRQAIERADVFVFTLGLTESWYNAQEDYEYPMCPGTVAGVYTPGLHCFRNLTFGDVLSSLAEAISLLRSVNSDLRFILTVSPVPLTATYSGKHVLVATVNSKSVLRSVAGEISQNDEGVDYFPSYEIINSPAFRSAFFEDNRRSVTPAGVDFVMGTFFQGVGRQAPAAEAGRVATDDDMIARRKARRARKARRLRQVEGRADAGDRRQGKGGRAAGSPGANRGRRRAARDAAGSPDRSEAVCEEELLAAFGARE